MQLLGSCCEEKRLSQAYYMRPLIYAGGGGEKKIEAFVQ